MRHFHECSLLFQFGGKEVGSFLFLTMLCREWVFIRLILESWEQRPSWGYCNKWPQTGWLKTMEIYWVIVLEARSGNRGVGRARLPPKPPGGEAVPWVCPGFWWFPAVLSLSWVVTACLQPLPPCGLLPSLCLSQFPSAYGDTHHLSGPVLMQ